MKLGIKQMCQNSLAVSRELSGWAECVRVDNDSSIYVRNSVLDTMANRVG